MLKAAVLGNEMFDNILCMLSKLSAGIQYGPVGGIRGPQWLG